MMRVSMVYLCLLLIRTQTKSSKVLYLANYAATYIFLALPGALSLGYACTDLIFPWPPVA